MNVEWGDVFSAWTASKTAVLFEDEAEINLILEYLRKVAESEIFPSDVNYKGGVHSTSTAYEMMDKNLNFRSLTELARDQLSEHMKIWETHLGTSGERAFEFPVVVRTHKQTNYFKIIFYIENLEQLCERTEIGVSFHVLNRVKGIV